MKSLEFSKHAAMRCAQRGIDKLIIDLILDYGRQDYDHKGGCRYFLGQPEKRQLLVDSPDVMKKFGRKLDVVVVTTAKDPSIVITAFVRDRRH